MYIPSGFPQYLFAQHTYAYHLLNKFKYPFMQFPPSAQLFHLKAPQQPLPLQVPCHSGFRVFSQSSTNLNSLIFISLVSLLMKFVSSTTLLYFLMLSYRENLRFTLCSSPIPASLRPCLFTEKHNLQTFPNKIV